MKRITFHALPRYYYRTGQLSEAHNFGFLNGMVGSFRVGGVAFFIIQFSDGFRTRHPWRTPAVARCDGVALIKRCDDVFNGTNHEPRLQHGQHRMGQVWSEAERGERAPAQMRTIIQVKHPNIAITRPPVLRRNDRIGFVPKNFHLFNG